MGTFVLFFDTSDFLGGEKFGNHKKPHRTRTPTSTPAPRLPA